MFPMWDEKKINPWIPGHTKSKYVQIISKWKITKSDCLDPIQQSKHILTINSNPCNSPDQWNIHNILSKKEKDTCDI